VSIEQASTTAAGQLRLAICPTSSQRSNVTSEDSFIGMRTPIEIRDPLHPHRITNLSPLPAADPHDLGRAVAFFFVWRHRTVRQRGNLDHS